MEVKKAAMAGTLESSDAQVTVEPGNDCSGQGCSGLHLKGTC